MQNDLYRLEDIIDVSKFQKIQDDIARATDMALLTVDYKGVPFTGHSQCQAHCTRIRELSPYRDLCQKCDSRGGLEAARLQKPYIYLCHQGLVDLAVPIIVNGQYLGAMMAGQIQLLDIEEADNLEQIVAKRLPKADSGSGSSINSESDFALEIEALRETLPKMTLAKVQAISSMLFHISQYIVEEAILKTSLTYFKQLDAQHHNLSEGVMELDAKALSPLPLASPLPMPLPSAKQDLLKPAFDYIAAHVHEALYIEQLATLCNVSVSYFSKCFNKATGMNFSAYHNVKKIEKAVTLLQTSNSSINQVSDALGFDTPGYFIKLFKQQIGVTPAVYRQQYQQIQQVNYNNQQSK